MYLNGEKIRFYTIAVLFGRLPTPKVNRCLYSTFDIRSHVISCLREYFIHLPSIKIPPGYVIFIVHGHCSVEAHHLAKTMDNIASSYKSRHPVAPIEGGRGAVAPPRFSKFFFYWFHWFDVHAYVHAYQDLVHFSTWIALIGGADTWVFGMMAQKKNFPYSKKFLPPRNLWIGATAAI